MRQVWIVLRREYLERVKTKGFILSTIAIPLLMLGMLGLSAFLGYRAQRSERELAIIDYTGLLGEEVADRIESYGYEMEVLDRDTDLDELDRQVLDEELEGFLVLDDLTLSEGLFAYRGLDSPGGARRGVFEAAVKETAIDLHLANVENGESLRALIEGSRLDFESVMEATNGEDAEVARVSGIAIGFAGAFLLYFTMILYGAYVLRSVLGRKTEPRGRGGDLVHYPMASHAGENPRRGFDGADAGWHLGRVGGAGRPVRRPVHRGPIPLGRHRRHYAVPARSRGARASRRLFRSWLLPLRFSVRRRWRHVQHRGRRPSRPSFP